MKEQFTVDSLKIIKRLNPSAEFNGDVLTLRSGGGKILTQLDLTSTDEWSGFCTPAGHCYDMHYYAEEENEPETISIYEYKVVKNRLETNTQKGISLTVTRV